MKRQFSPVIGGSTDASMKLRFGGHSKHVINVGAIKGNAEIWRFHVDIAYNVSHGVFMAS